MATDWSGSLMAEDMYPKPSVGKIVHYLEGVDCVATMITAVDKEQPHKVSLVCFYPDETIHRHNVKYHPKSNGSWHWPERV